MRLGATVTTSIELAREFGPFIRERADGCGPKQPKFLHFYGYTAPLVFGTDTKLTGVVSAYCGRTRIFDFDYLSLRSIPTTFCIPA